MGEDCPAVSAYYPQSVFRVRVANGEIADLCQPLADNPPICSVHEEFPESDEGRVLIYRNHLVDFGNQPRNGERLRRDAPGIRAEARPAAHVVYDVLEFALLGVAICFHDFPERSGLLRWALGV